MDDARFESLSDRQRRYLRLVADLCTSTEIAYREGSTSKAVDKQLKLACDKLGVSSRIDAARLHRDFEARVEAFYPQGRTNFLSRSSFWRLPWPLPSKAQPMNILSRQQVLAWAVVISIVTLLGLTFAAMVIVAIALLLGVHL